LGGREIEPRNGSRDDDLPDVPVGFQKDVVDGAGEFEELGAKEHEAGVGLRIGIDDEDPAIFPRQPSGDVQGACGLPDTALVIYHRDDALRDLSHEFTFS
jgi:hypothetical protein